jgi:hypothetical protein
MRAPNRRRPIFLAVAFVALDVEARKYLASARGVAELADAKALLFAVGLDHHR